MVGFHFFNPVAVLPLLEIARADKTDDASLATAFAVGKTLKKSCVLVADRPAFIVNRLLTRFLGEVTKAVDEGTPFEVADKALEPLGLPMSPFVLLQLVGPAVALHVAETMHEAFPDRFAVSENLGRLVAAGKSGVYVWEGSTPKVDPEVAELFQQGDVAAGRGGGPTACAGRARRGDPADARRGRRRRTCATSTWRCCSAPAGRSTSAASRRTSTARACRERVTGARFLEPGVASLPRG